MRKNMKLAAMAAAPLLFVVAAPAVAGTKDDVRDLQARMAEVERGVEAGSAATVRISELEREIQLLTGQVETLRYELEQTNARLSAVTAVLAGDPAGLAPTTGAGVSSAPGAGAGPIDLSTGDPIAGQIASAETSGASAASVPTASDVALPLDPDAAFDYASSFLLSGDYPRAKSAFALYVEAFPSHARTADARFRLGEIHLALSENAAAADVFIEHIRAYPNDPRAAEAYLKLGTAFSRLERPSEACKVFRSMKSKFPNAATAVHDRANLEMARADCR
ncbi:MAG: tetratricopeptide repeat protein [Pseudomonadota bacterium]